MVVVSYGYDHQSMDWRSSTVAIIQRWCRLSQRLAYFVRAIARAISGRPASAI